MHPPSNYPITRALISVSDKYGIVEFARSLCTGGVEILSTGGTAKLLLENDIKVIEVSEHTGFPEIFEGRVKTLHPRIHGGILARRGIDDAVMLEHDISPIDLVVVNLYPFAETVARPDCSLGRAIESIDIGGATLLRAAAKNHTYVTVVVEPADYARVTEEMGHNQGYVSLETRFGLAAKAFEHVACYERAIADYLSARAQKRRHTRFPQTLALHLEKVENLRYGENPHQGAAFYRVRDPTDGSLASARKIQGKALSYNNIADADTALECVNQFDTPACVIVKHANPCGVATGQNIMTSYQRAFEADPVSAYGGIIAFNQTLDGDTAAEIIERQFVELIAAPEVGDVARSVLAENGNVRVLECGRSHASRSVREFDFKRVSGGLLVQDSDVDTVTAGELKVVTQRKPTDAELKDLQFAWCIVKFVKSNAIVYARAGQTIGIGAGQMSRLYSAKLAAMKAAEAVLSTDGAVMASDAFFPFRDGIDVAHQAGISAVIQPGGSRKDEEIIAAADQHGMAMVFTSMRHFRH